MNSTKTALIKTVLRDHCNALLTNGAWWGSLVEEMYLEVEMARSMSAVLAMRLRDEDAQTPQLAAATKARIARAGDFIGENGVQLHGGIGMTDECNIGFYIKRARVAQQTFGGRSYHMNRFASLNNY